MKIPPQRRTQYDGLVLVETIVPTLSGAGEVRLLLVKPKDAPGHVVVGRVEGGRVVDEAAGRDDPIDAWLPGEWI